MKKQLKKGFTLTELVIVIVIIAILAAVLIPTYTGLVQKAKDSNDTNLVKLLNDALMTAEIEETPSTMQDAVDVLDDIGYKVPSLQAKASKNTLVWNQVTNRFYIYSDGEVDIRDASPDPSEINFNGSKLTSDANKYTFWVISDTVALTDTFSTYYTGKDETINTSKGFDAGTTTSVKTINYTNSNSFQDVIIRSNSAATNVKVTAPLDTISHYGSAGAVTLTKVSTSSFWEYGKVAFVELTEGRIVLTEDSDVEVINVTKKADATAEANDYYYNPIIADGGVLEENMPEIISRDQVTVKSTEGKTKLVQVQTLDSNGDVISSATEQVYAYANGTTGTTEKTTSQNTEIDTTLGIIVLDSNGKAGQKAYSEAQKTEEKDNVVTKAVDKEIVSNKL